jgi:hypothetical protein
VDPTLAAELRERRHAGALRVRVRVRVRVRIRVRIRVWVRVRVRARVRVRVRVTLRAPISCTASAMLLGSPTLAPLPEPG